MNKGLQWGSGPRGLISVLTLLYALWASMASASEFSRQVRFDIPAQQLSAALIQFSSQTNVQVITKAADVSGLLTSGVSGTMPIEIGLKQLLDGTGFSYLLVGDGTVEIAAEGGRTVTSSTGLASSEQSVIRLVQVTTPNAAAKAQGNSAETRAQAASNADNSTNKLGVSEVTVVGSRLSGPADKKAQPITVIDRSTIQRSGVSSIVQALNNLPQVSINATTSPFQSSRGSNTVQLRGLPGGTTLVLLNGRRLVATPFQSSSGVTNLNVLPLSAVERIEVLPSGSSAIYGGDALAGVVNIAFKRDFEGLDISVRGGVADDYTERQAALSAGHVFSRGNISFIASFSENSELLGSERAITADTDYRRFGGPNMSQPYTSPANIYSLNGQNLPGLTSTTAGVPRGQNGVGLTQSSFAATAGATYSDPGFWALASQRTPGLQYSALLSGTYALSDSVELFAEMLYSHYEAKELDYPYYLSGGQFGTSRVPASNPFNPFGVDVGINYLFKGAGRFCYCLNQEYTRPLAGVRGDLGNRWKWELGASLTRGRDQQREGPFLDSAKVAAALADPNPATALNVFADRTWTFDEIAHLTYTAPTNLLSEQYTVDGFIRGPLFDLPAGPVQVSFGGEYARAKLDYGYYLTFFQASRHNSALSAEVRVPILGSGASGGGERIALTGAVRYDDYSDFGEKTSPQFGIEIRPWSNLLIRGAYSAAYKPPTLYQLNQPINTYNRGDTLVDPRRGRETYPFVLRQGGNPFLQALTGDSTSAGFVFSPAAVPGLEITATHWTTKIDNYASFVSYQTVVDYESVFSQYITRAAPSPADIAAGLPGRITNILNVTLNYGTFDLAGIDMGVTWRRPLGLGEWVTTAAASQTYKYDAALTPGLPSQNRAGKANSGGFAPKWKGVLSTGWNLENLQLTLTGRYTGKYEDYMTTNPLGNFWLMDVNARYDVGNSLLNSWESLRGAYVSLGAVNVLNKLPEFSYAASNLGYDPRQADIRGRFMYLQLGIRF